MPNVEVLSLSVNKIRSLQDFAYCSNLTELYLRKNEVCLPLWSILPLAEHAKPAAECASQLLCRC